MGEEADALEANYNGPYDFLKTVIEELLRKLRLNSQRNPNSNLAEKKKPIDAKDAAVLFKQESLIAKEVGQSFVQNHARLSIKNIFRS